MLRTQFVTFSLSHRELKFTSGACALQICASDRPAMAPYARVEFEVDVILSGIKIE